MRRLLLGLSAFMAFAPLGAQTATTQMQAVSSPAEVDKTTQTEDVKFHNEEYDRMTVPVRLSGTGPYRFLVDTGADRTAISRQLAAQLNLVSGLSAELHSVAGISKVSTATVPSLELTSNPMRIVDAALLDSANMGADGILGVDSLHSQRVTFDFAAQTMSIVPSAARDFADEPGTIVVQANRRNGRLVVTDANASGLPLTVVLDTGSQLSIGNLVLRDRLLRKNLVDGAREVELQSVTGETLKGEFMFVRELEIGGVTLRNLVVVFADAHTFKQLQLNSKPALLLGMNAMRAFKKVSIDFASRKLRVIIPEHSAADVQMAWPGVADRVARRPL